MSDKKEAAEHATTVDLIRNDLSRVAERHKRVSFKPILALLTTRTGLFRFVDVFLPPCHSLWLDSDCTFVGFARRYLILGLFQASFLCTTENGSENAYFRIASPVTAQIPAAANTE